MREITRERERERDSQSDRQTHPSWLMQVVPGVHAVHDVSPTAAYSPRLQHTAAPAGDDFPATPPPSAPNACRLGRSARGQEREGGSGAEREGGGGGREKEKLGKRVDREVGECLPATHEAHEDATADGEYMPAAHSVHVAVAASVYVVIDVPWYLPAAHGRRIRMRRRPLSGL